jgi:hypothetical protein
LGSGVEDGAVGAADGSFGGGDEEEGAGGDGAIGRRDGGTGEKCVYDSPEKSVEWMTEGGVKIVDCEGASFSMSTSVSFWDSLAMFGCCGRVFPGWLFDIFIEYLDCPPSHLSR